MSTHIDIKTALLDSFCAQIDKKQNKIRPFDEYAYNKKMQETQQATNNESAVITRHLPSKVIPCFPDNDNVPLIRDELSSESFDHDKTGGVSGAGGGGGGDDVDADDETTHKKAHLPFPVDGPPNQAFQKSHRISNLLVLRRQRHLQALEDYKEVKL